MVIKEDITMLELHHLSKRLEEELKIRIFQIAIHKDEGHYDKDNNEWKPNYHAHLVADWQDLETGKTLKHQSFYYSKMQDLASECLGMERGKSNTGIHRLEAIEFKIKKKEEYLKELEAKQQELNELIKIGKGVSERNNIPNSVFNEIYSDTKKMMRLYNLLRYGNTDGQKPAVKLTLTIQTDSTKNDSLTQKQSEPKIEYKETEAERKKDRRR